MDLCGPSCPRATPTKRAMGQCTCVEAYQRANTHRPGCPAIYPRQPAPGDEPDALMRLVRHVRGGLDFCDKNEATWASAALDLISEVRTEIDLHKKWRTMLEASVQTLRRGQQRASEARQAAFREMAEEMWLKSSSEREAHLRRVLEGNGGET